MATGARALLRLPGAVRQGILARAALVVLRLYLGVVFLVLATPSAGGEATAGSAEMLARLAAPEQARLYATAFAAVEIWGAMIVGILLVLGLLTRLAAAAALLLALPPLFAAGGWAWTTPGSYGAIVAIALGLLIGAAGRTLGIDAALARRWPRSPFW